MRRTIFQQLKVLINHKTSYIVSLFDIFVNWVSVKLEHRLILEV